jgi:anti-sigma regulatory factor (Ser/Thr protein kinase)
MQHSASTRGRRLRGRPPGAPRRRRSAFRPREATIPADSAQIGRARAFADAAANVFGFDQDSRFAFRMAISEVVANAIEHGSSSGDDVVRLRAVEEEDGALAFYVTDVGAFFPREALSEDALRERGRGIEMIRWLMDELDVRSGYEGTVIRFAKRLAA